MVVTETVYIVRTAEGQVAWRESERGVTACSLPQPDRGTALARLGVEQGEDTDAARHEIAARLCDYYEGGRVELGEVPLDLGGQTEFQAAVRAIVRAIPAGRTMTYGEVAREAGHPGAARAVGQVMATNPVPPFIPCHRVIAANGDLGGFGGGLALKRRLLDREE